MTDNWFTKEEESTRGIMIQAILPVIIPHHPDHDGHNLTLDFMGMDLDCLLAIYDTIIEMQVQIAQLSGPPPSI